MVANLVEFHFPRKLRFSIPIRYLSLVALGTAVSASSESAADFATPQPRKGSQSFSNYVGLLASRSDR